MTSRPRLLVVPCLLVLAASLAFAVALLGDPVGGPLEGALLPSAGLLLVAAGWSFWTLRGLASDLDQTIASAGLHSALLEDVFAAKAITVLVATDELGAITRFNPGAEAVVGVSGSLALGRSPSFFLDETEIASWALAMRTEQNFAAVAAGLVGSDQQQPIEWPFRRPDGERRMLSMTISPIRAPGEEVTGYLFAGRDVTDEEAGDSGTEQFLATMSLELRAPMASILGYAEMLQEEMGDLTVNAGVRNFVDRIERNGQRMLLLIQDLLTLTRVEDPELELHRDEIDLRNLVSSAYDDLRVRTHGRQIDLSLRLPPDPVIQDCDPKLVEQVVTQLLVNASKFTPDGGRIVASLKSNGSVSRIVVGDTGLGISQTDRERLFTRFFRSHQPEVQQVQGSGLGLAIVGAVVAAHRGSVSVETELGRGSTFVVELPARPFGTGAASTEVDASPSMSV